MSVIIRVKTNINPIEHITFHPVGDWKLPSNIDKILAELCVKRLLGKYFIKDFEVNDA